MTHAIGPDGRCLGCLHKADEAHPYLKGWFFNLVLPRFPRAHISWGYRNQADQADCVKNGSSKLAWPKSKHNRRVAINESQPYNLMLENDPNTRPESAALDLFELMAGHALYDPVFFARVNRENEYYGFPILWGGKFPSLGDMDHFQYQLIK